MAPHSSTLAWKIPRTEEPVRLQSMGSLRVGHDWVTSLSLFTFMHWRRKWQPTPVFLPGESQGMGEPGRLSSMGSHRVRHDWSDLAAAAYDTCICQDMDLVKTFGYSQISDTSVCPCTHPGVSCEEGKERNYWIEVHINVLSFPLMNFTKFLKVEFFNLPIKCLFYPWHIDVLFIELWEENIYTVMD